MKIYRCKHCGNIVTLLTDKGGKLSCCNDEMELLNANTVDASVEKHVPVVEKDGNIVNVKIGEVPHPMLLEHHIEWIILETNLRTMIAHLKINSEPKASFVLLDGEEIVTCYEYCNLHSLWKK